MAEPMARIGDEDVDLPPRCRREQRIDPDRCRKIGFDRLDIDAVAAKTSLERIEPASVNGKKMFTDCAADWKGRLRGPIIPP